jgi:cytochrome P450
LLSSDTGGDRDGGGTLIEDLPGGFAAGVLFNMMDDPRHQQIRRLVTPSLTDRFDITRGPNPHLAFGTGTHFCLGANLARLEIRLVLDGLLDRVAEIVPAGPVERTRSNKHAGFRHAPVRFIPLPR